MRFLVVSNGSLSSAARAVLRLPFFLCVLTVVAHAAPPTPAPNALPTSGQVVAGSASISSTSTANTAVMNINQTSQRAVINWDSFNVGKNAAVNFNQPNANAVTLNRVTGATASLINGAINANGQVILVNSNGVVFGRGAEINAAAVVASTMNIADREFMDGKSTFIDDGTGIGPKAGKIINKGSIQTNSDGGFIALLAPEVRNQGYLFAQKGGTVAIGSGSQITLKIQGQSLIAVSVDEAVYNGLISNKRIIEAPGGLVVLATNTANQIMAGVIKNTGRISANSLVNNGGTIELVANNVTQAGVVTANSQTAQGGQINLVGQDITVGQNSTTTAIGATGGGQVNIGLANTQVSGGSQVNVPTQAGIKANAERASSSQQLAKSVTVEQNAIIDTSATQAGNGGAIAIWSEVKTTVAGILKSMGGILSGNGGFIETSSKGQVSLGSTASIDASAPKGNAGTWLLDPVDLFINATAASTISAALSNSNVAIEVTLNNSNTACSLGICIGAGTGAMIIDSGAHILKAGTNYTTLTLSAAGNFNLSGSITGQNLDVVINSSIAYLGVGSSIDASKVKIQAQTIISYGRIQTSNYLFGGGAGSLGNAIELLAQSIFISGALRLNVSPPLVPATIPSPVDLNALAGNVGLNKIYSTTAANDSSLLTVSAATQAASNVIKLTGIQLTAGSYSVVGLEGTSEVLANGSTGGSIYLSANDIYTRSGSFLQANGTVGAGGLIDMMAENITLAGNVSAGGVGSGNGGSISLIANTGTIDLRGGVIQANPVGGNGGSLYAEVSAISTILADNVLSAGMPSSSFDLSKVLFIRERTNSAASGSLNLGYQVLNASGNEVTLGAGSYVNLSIAGTPSYFSNGSAITNAVGVGSYSNLMVKGLTLSGSDSGQFLLVSIPVLLNVTSAQATAPMQTVVSAAPPPLPPPLPPPVALSPPLPTPTKAEVAPPLAFAPPPAAPPTSTTQTTRGEVSAPPVARPAPLTVQADGTIVLTPPPAPGAATPPPPPPPPAAAPSARNATGKEAAKDGLREGSKDRPKDGLLASSDSKKLGASPDGVDKPAAKELPTRANTIPSKYVSKYANGLRAAEKVAAKNNPAKPVAANKPSAPRDGKYNNRVNAINNNPAAFIAMRQNPFAGNISPFPPGVAQPVVMPVVLKGGDSLVQSYDDVPSIRNSGVANVARSRNSENYHESLESVNLMSTLNLFIIR